MKDIFDVDFDTADTLYKSPQFANVKRLIVTAIGKSRRGVSIRVIKTRLRLSKREDGIIYPAIRELERDGEITNVAKKDISGESLGASLYVLGGKGMEKLVKVVKKHLTGDKVFATAKKSVYPDLGL